MRVYEQENVVRYLRSRNLVKQYKKAKCFLQQGNFKAVDFKKRRPKSSDIWYFRITRKYRAYCSWEDDKIVVFDVDDHQ